MTIVNRLRRVGRLDAVREALAERQQAVARRQIEAAQTALADLEPIPIAATLNAEGDEQVPRGLQVAAGWAWRVILLAGFLYGLVRFVGYLSEVTIPLAIAILLAALLSPVKNRMQGWGVPRALATAISLIGGLLLVVGALFLIGNQIANQASDLSDSVIKGFNRLLGWLATSPLHIDQPKLTSYVNRLQTFLVNSRSTIAKYAAEIGTSVGKFLAGFFITMFATFYFLFDGRGIFRFLLIFFPRSSRRRVDGAARRGWMSLVHYVRAVIIVAFADAVGVLIAALVLRIPAAPALAALVFIGAFVPLVGAFVSGFVAVAVALVALGWIQALIMLAAMIAVMQVEGHLLQPLLLGRAVSLHPLAVLVSIAIGIIAGGIVGALVAVPILAFTKTFVQALVGEDPSEPAVAGGPTAEIAET